MVKLTQFRFGPGFYQGAGTEIELTTDEEAQLVKAGMAEKIETQAVVPQRQAARKTKHQSNTPETR